MTIRADCSFCGRIHNLNDKFAGRKVKCLGCEQPMMVPGADEVSAAPSGNREAKPTPSRSLPRRPVSAPEADEQPANLTDSWGEDSDTAAAPVPRKKGLPPRRTAQLPEESEDESSFEAIPRPDRGGKKKRAREPKRRRESDSPSALAQIGKSIGVVLVVLLSIAAAVGKSLKRWHRMDRMDRQIAGATTDAPGNSIQPSPHPSIFISAPVTALGAPGDSTKPFPVSSAPSPAFPAFEQRPGEHLLTFPGFAREPGGNMQLAVYIPPGDLKPHSLPCVLVAPAGTNLLTGMKIGPTDRPEHLPYLSAGYVVVCYSLDGNFDKTNPHATDIQWSHAYSEFVAAHAGLTNARNALDFVLEKIPAVDPERIYSAGHSSAATTSLLFAEHEPRLKGCIAYAPITDLERQYSKLLADPDMPKLLPGITALAKRMSPKTHAASMNCPVFLFCARDDAPEVVGDVNQFAAQLNGLGKSVVLYQVPTGGHYESMLAEGIPQATAWLQTLPGNDSAGMAPATRPQQQQQQQQQPPQPAPVHSQTQPYRKKPSYLGKDPNLRPNGRPLQPGTSGQPGF